MKETGYILSLKHSLWHMLAGTRGGVTRIRILELIKERPYNINQIHDNLGMDYKTIQHHIWVLVNERIISNNEEKRYGTMYYLTPLLEENMHLFEEILEKIGKKEIKTVNK